MRKLTLFLIAIVITFSSCGNDDDSTTEQVQEQQEQEQEQQEEEQQDQIIGTWTYHQAFTNGVEETLTNCDKQDTLIFNLDGSYQGKFYYDNDNGDCVLDSTISGTWNNKGNSIYEIVIDGEAFDEEITFENNTFYFEEEDGSDTYKEVYIKN